MEIRANTAEMKRMLRAETTALGIGCTATGAVTVLTFWVRYHEIRRGRKMGPRVKRRVFRLVSVSMKVF